MIIKVFKLSIFADGLEKSNDSFSNGFTECSTLFCGMILKIKEVNTKNKLRNDNGNLKITKKDRLKITNYGEKTKSIWLSFHFVYT